MELMKSTISSEWEAKRQDLVKKNQQLRDESIERVFVIDEQEREITFLKVEKFFLKKRYGVQACNKHEGCRFFKSMGGH